jgi:uncharacterized protein with gpF-like domain
VAADEEEIRSGWLSAARTWAAGAADRVMAPFRQGGVTPDPVWVLSTRGVWVEQLTRDVSPPILAALRRAYQTIAGTVPPSFDTSQYVADYLATSVNRMSQTPDQVYREITDQIAIGVNEGESVPELAARVQAVFEVTGNPWWENRATVVARTEAHAALNAGSLSGAGQQQIDTGRQMVKVWLAIDQPDRTRPAHLAADGQARALTSPFIVGDEALQYPGDPAGSAGNVIQCRCSMTFREA